MSRARSKVLGCVVAVAVLGGACSDGGEGTKTSATPTTVKYDVAKGVESPAAELRADLTAVLQEHVLLVGITTATQLAGQDTAPAAAVLDQNATALAAVVSGLYDDPTGPEFLRLWQLHTAGLVGFTSVAASDDKAAVAKAKADLKAVQGQMATVLNTANPQLTAEVLTEALGSYATGVQTAITAQAKKDPMAPAKLKVAADEMATTAIVLAAGIVKQKKKELPGKIDAISAVMRTSLAVKLQEHAYLAGITTATTLGGGDAAPASEALDENSRELSRAVGSVYGDDAGRRFLQLWRQHITFIVDFTEAAAAGDAAKKTAARAALDDYRATFATFLNGANPNLTTEAVAGELGEHIDSLLLAIEAQAAKDPAQVAKLREAAMHMPDTALLLATGIARQFPTKFG